VLETPAYASVPHTGAPVVHNGAFVPHDTPFAPVARVLVADGPFVSDNYSSGN